MMRLNADVTTEPAAMNTERFLDADVLFMPEGMTSEQLAETRALTANLAMKHGFRYTPRLHVNLWEDAPGL